MAEATLEQIVNQAADAEETVVDAPAETVPAAEKAEESDEDSEESDEEEVEETEEKKPTELETQQALNLYRILNDPKQAPALIEMLAKQIGLTEQSTKKEVATGKRAIRDVLQEALGDEFSFFGEKLTPALEKLFESEFGEVRAELRKLREESQLSQLKSEVDNAFSHLERVTKGDSKQYMDQIVSLMDDIKPGDKTSTKDYIHKLYKIAKADQLEKSEKRKLTNKINRNANDIASRVSGASRGGSESGGQKALTLDQAIQFALSKQQK